MKINIKDADKNKSLCLYINFMKFYLKHYQDHLLFYLIVNWEIFVVELLIFGILLIKLYTIGSNYRALKILFLKKKSQSSSNPKAYILLKLTLKVEYLQIKQHISVFLVNKRLKLTHSQVRPWSLS